MYKGEVLTILSDAKRKPANAYTGMFLVEAILIVGLFWADIHHWHHIVVFSKTPYLLVLGWCSLHMRGQRWSSIGMCQPASWPRAIILGAMAGCAMEALELFVSQPLLTRAFHQPPDLSALSALRGNAGMLALVLLLSWTLAAFGEELVWRGYLLNRINQVLGRVFGHWAISLVATSIVFGVAHFDQGRTGIAENMIDGALLGGLYLAGGRNLWLPILAHGVTDSIDSLLLFSGHYPLSGL
jgi:hypothetical protein